MPGYIANAENGGSIANPSEDGLFMMFRELKDTDNKFVGIQPDGEDQDWFAAVSLLDEGGYEVELRDIRYREHELTVHHDLGRVAQEVTIWLAARFGVKPSPELQETTTAKSRGARPKIVRRDVARRA